MSVLGVKVLVVDDEPCVREPLQAAVEDLGYACAAARNGVEAWELYTSRHFDVVLSDWYMPEMDGLELCRRIRGDRGEAPYTYFILLTGASDRARLVQALRAGADEYLSKPLDVDELEARLQAASRVSLANRFLRMDPLTGVFSRVGLEADLERAIADRVRYGRRSSVALCDVDFFKRYNDRFGHVVGDGVLRRVAATMRGALRDVDRVYRYGGDEFLVLLPEQAVELAGIAMERVRGEIASSPLSRGDGEAPPPVSISVGIAELDVRVDRSVADLLRRADLALYRAKDLGRNRVAIEVVPEPAPEGKPR